MKRISILFLLTAFFLPSQGQNIYTRFVESSKVTWAIDGTDTFRFINPNLSLLLRQQLAKEKIKVAQVDPGSSSFPDIRKVKKQEVIQVIAPNRTVQVMDSEGNVAGTVVEAEDPLLSSKYFDEETNAKIEIAQIFYIEKGLLKSYAPWVSPKYTITTSWGERLGIANAFSTAFGTSKSFSRRYKRKSISLGSHARTLYQDSSIATKMLKQLYGQSLAQALWPYLGKKHYGLKLPGTGASIALEKLNQTLIEESPIAVPVYDEEGNVTPKGVILQETQPLNLTQVTRIDIIQDWYYYAKKNRLYPVIKELTLFAVRSKAGVPATTASPILSILVKQ